MDVVDLLLCFSYQFSAFLGSIVGPSFYLLIQFNGLLLLIMATPNLFIQVNVTQPIGQITRSR